MPREKIKFALRIHPETMLLVKLTVELSMVMNILAAAADVDESKLPGLRERCIREIRGTSGAIKFDDAVRYQRGS